MANQITISNAQDIARTSRVVREDDNDRDEVQIQPQSRLTLARGYVPVEPLPRGVSIVEDN